jgi:hypothetical protein
LLRKSSGACGQYYLLGSDLSVALTASGLFKDGRPVKPETVEAGILEVPLQHLGMAEPSTVELVMQAYGYSDALDALQRFFHTTFALHVIAQGSGLMRYEHGGVELYASVHNKAADVDADERHLLENDFVAEPHLQIWCGVVNIVGTRTGEYIRVLEHGFSQGWQVDPGNYVWLLPAGIYPLWLVDAIHAIMHPELWEVIR